MFKTFHQAPFLRITLFFIAGIVFQYNCNTSFYLGYILILPLLLLIPTFFSRINKQYDLRYLFGLSILLFTFLSAAFLTQIAWKKSEWTVDGVYSYVVRVLDDPVDKPNTRMCKVEIISTDSAIRKMAVNKKAIIYLPKDNASSEIIAGDGLFIKVSLSKPQQMSGDASFDYPLYLRKQSYSAIGFVRKQNWQREFIPIPAQECFRYKALEIRRKLLSRLRVILPDSNSFSLSAALMFGYKAEMDRELRQNFSNIGAGHILAVSGLHFGLIFGMVAFFLSFMGERKEERIIKLFIFLPLIWGFAFVTGLPPSVVRAACMMSFWRIGNALSYRAFGMNTLASIAFLMLLYNPLYLFDIGFQLSFSAVVSIIIINPGLIRLYTSNNRIINYFWDLSCVSVSAQIGVLPLSMYYFHQLPLLFLLTNLLILPLVGILLFLIPFALFLQFIFGNYEWLNFPLQWILSGCLSIVQALDSIPRGTISNIDLSVFETVLLYIGIAFIVYLALRKKTI